MNQCLWANDMDKYACGIYRRHWNDEVMIQKDIRELLNELKPEDAGTVDVICGGDPCPSRSVLRGNRPTKHPDLSGYFLAVVGRLRPQWVVRENVCAPDVKHFAVGLGLLGYGVSVVQLDARDFTGQSRRRQFCIGCPPELRARFERSVSDAANSSEINSPRLAEKSPVTTCLTTNASKLATETTFCFEAGRGLRILDSTEREVLQGFPRGWTDGLSHSCRGKLLGNAVNVSITKWLAERIMETIDREFTFAELFAGIGGFRLGFESAQHVPIK